MRINATLIQSATCDEGQFGSHVYEIFLSWVPGVAGMATTYMRIFLPYRFTDDLVQELPALVGVVLAVDGGGEAGVDYAVREDVRDSHLWNGMAVLASGFSQTTTAEAGLVEEGSQSIPSLGLIRFCQRCPTAV